MLIVRLHIPDDGYYSAGSAGIDPDEGCETFAYCHEAAIDNYWMLI